MSYMTHSLLLNVPVPLQIRLPANPSQAFNVKQTDTFNIKASDVGALNYVIMRIEATGASTQVSIGHHRWSGRQ
jgi:hypothetical protein